MQSTSLSEIQKEVLCFPGGSSLMLPLFSGTKQVFSGEGDRLTLPSQQHLAPLQVQNTHFGIQVAARGVGGGGEGFLSSVSATETSPGRGHWVFG